MEKTYNEINMYYIKNEVIYLIPTGECVAFGGANIGIEPIEILKLPTTQNLLSALIDKCFLNCWKQKITEIPKGLNNFEKLVKVKSHKQAVEKYDLLTLSIDKLNQTYTLSWNWKKQKNHYNNPEYVEMNKKIDLDFILSIIQD